MADEHEQRWMLYPTTTGYVGPKIGVVTEVVPASRLAEAETQASEARVDAMEAREREAGLRHDLERARSDADGFGRAADAYLAQLERAREALEILAQTDYMRPAQRRLIASKALDSLAACSPSTTTEARDGASE